MLSCQTKRKRKREGDRESERRKRIIIDSCELRNKNDDRRNKGYIFLDLSITILTITASKMESQEKTGNPIVRTNGLHQNLVHVRRLRPFRLFIAHLYLSSLNYPPCMQTQKQYIASVLSLSLSLLIAGSK